jgi:ATP-binding cassette, subfamily C (CFTR/MRP), member 1
MDVDGPWSQSILSTDTFLGVTELPQLASGYLSATKQWGQPLCANEEGWGPLSNFRFDFTPCFMDVWVSSVAVYGIVFGLGTVWWLLNRKKAQEVKKDWHFWLKQVSSP